MTDLEALKAMHDKLGLKYRIVTDETHSWLDLSRSVSPAPLMSAPIPQVFYGDTEDDPDDDILEGDWFSYDGMICHFDLEGNVLSLDGSYDGYKPEWVDRLGIEAKRVGARV